MRLDEYAHIVLDPLPSRRSAYKAAKRGDLLLDGRQSPPNTSVRPGQRLTLLESSHASPASLDLALRVLLQDDVLAVIEKPAGLPASGYLRRTVVRALPPNLTPSPCLDALRRPHPVHRLDAPTGGLLLIAKTASAMVSLSRQFQERRVRKRYRGIVVGRLEGRGRVCEPVDGRSAETVFRAVEHTRSLRTEWLTTLDLWPRTGRTHQLRRHLAGLGHPIVGDRRYGETGQTFRGKGLFLWAIGLGFEHPETGERVTVRIDVPPKFHTYRGREQRRWDRTNGDDRCGS